MVFIRWWVLLYILIYRFTFRSKWIVLNRNWVISYNPYTRVNHLETTHSANNRQYNQNHMLDQSQQLHNFPLTVINRTCQRQMHNPHLDNYWNVVNFYFMRLNCLSEMYRPQHLIRMKSMTLFLRNPRMYSHWSTHMHLLTRQIF